MTHKIMPYVLPLASVLVISALFMFAKPTITGFFIAQQNPILNAEIKITADDILPEDAIVVISLLDRDNRTLIELIKSDVKGLVAEYNLNLSYGSGRNSELDYEGNGYRGWSVIILTRDLDGINKGNYFLKTTIVYKDKIIFETQREIEI